MRPLLAAALLALPLAAAAQPLVDFSKSRLSQPPLRFPDKPAETAPRQEPDMGAYKPAGPGPFPAVVVYHTCAGIQDQVGEWANILVKAGYVAFVLDSFSQRGLRFGENCRPPPRVNTMESALDAYQALEYLAAQPYVDRERIGLIGFSWGAMVGLLVARKDIAAILPRRDKDLRFRAVAALYPHCYLPSIELPGGAVSVEWLGPQTDRPLLVLMGGRDEETPPRFCLPRLEALKAKGAAVDWHVYPEATHAFDSRSASGHRAPTLFGGTHTYRYDAEVTRASQGRVMQFLAKELAAR